MAAAAAAASTTKNGFLEFVELSESYTESRQWHSPRISFSNEFAQPTEDEGENSTAEGSSGGAAASQGSSVHNPSSSGEFEFNMAAATTQPPVKCPMLSADELFYKGKLLPLHLPPRIRMVQDLSEVEEKQLMSRSPALGGMMMRRERSLRSPARPSVVPCTLKSSSYPPPGCSSRPPSPPKAAKCSSRWRDLFGFKKGHQQQQIAAPKPPIAAAASTASRQAAPSRLLKMIFNRGSSSSCSSSSEQHPAAAGLGQHEVSSSNEALLPLLRDSSSDSSCPVAEMCHSSSISSTSSFSSSASSNWAASSASSSTASSSSFSADFPEVCSTSSTTHKAEVGGGAVSSCRKPEKLGNNNRGGRGIGSPGRRRGVAGRVALLNKAVAVAAAPAPGVDARVVVMKNLQRCGSNRKAASMTTSSMGKMDHGNHKPLSMMRPHSDGWRRPEKAGGNNNNSNNGASYSSSVRVTPVLHVPACIGPSLRSVRVHGFRRLFSSSSSSSSASGSSKPTGTEGVVVM